MDRARARPLLDSFKGKAAGNPSFFAAMLGADAGTFFPRCLRMVFVRSVTAVQVMDSLAEKIKPVVTADTFSAFSDRLLSGVGKSGLKAGEHLTFFWAAPDILRVIVRGKVSGDVRDAKLPLVLHKGFLGDNPVVPEAKESVASGLSRLYQGGAEIDDLGSSGGGAASRIGRPVPMPGIIVEPATKLEFKTPLCLPGPNGDIAMQLLAKGPKVKKIPMIGAVQVYAVGIYVEPVGCKKVLAAPNGWWEQSKSGGSNHASLYDALVGGGDDRSFFPRSLHLVFARSVSYSQVAGALAEKLKLVAPPAAFEKLSVLLETGIGKASLKVGETITYFWCELDCLRVLVRGAVAGDIRDAFLPRMMHKGFLGADPSSPEAYAEVPQGAMSLLRGAGGMN